MDYLYLWPYVWPSVTPPLTTDKDQFTWVSYMTSWTRQHTYEDSSIMAAMTRMEVHIMLLCVYLLSLGWTFYENPSLQSVMRRLAGVSIKLLLRMSLLGYLVHIHLDHPSQYTSCAHYELIVTLPSNMYAFWILFSRGCCKPLSHFVTWTRRASDELLDKPAVNATVNKVHMYVKKHWISKSAIDIRQTVPPPNRTIDIFSKPIASRSLESLAEGELVDKSTFIVPQEGDGITWDKSVVLAPKEMDEIALVLKELSSLAVPKRKKDRPSYAISLTPLLFTLAMLISPKRAKMAAEMFLVGHALCPIIAILEDQITTRSLSTALHGKTSNITGMIRSILTRNAFHRSIAQSTTIKEDPEPYRKGSCGDSLSTHENSDKIPTPTKAATGPASKFNWTSLAIRTGGVIIQLADKYNQMTLLNRGALF